MFELLSGQEEALYDTMQNKVPSQSDVLHILVQWLLARNVQTTRPYSLQQIEPNY